MARNSAIILFCGLIIACLGYAMYGRGSVTPQPASPPQLAVPAPSTATVPGNNVLAREEQAGEEPKPAPSEAAPDERPEVPDSAGRESGSEDLAARQQRAAAFTQQASLDRDAILADLEQQSLEEAVAEARKIGPDMSFTLRPGMPMIGFGSFAQMQQTLLEDPRFARIAAAAMHGSDSERARLRDAIHQVLTETLRQKRNYLDGVDYDPGKTELNVGAAIYPIVLAQLDEDGSSLPILMEWYRIEEEQAWGGLQGVMAAGNLPPHPSPNAKISAGTSQMPFIASAARVIAERVGGGEAVETPLEEQWVFGGGRWGIETVDQAQGFPLLPEYDSAPAPPTAEELLDLLGQRIPELLIQ